MSWREEWETGGYVRSLSDDDQNVLRVRVRIERGPVVRFVAHFEVIIEGERRPVVRYDTAHGYAHRDLLDWRGHEIQKEWIADLEGYKQAFTDAIRDLQANWRTYRDDCERRKP